MLSLDLPIRFPNLFVLSILWHSKLSIMDYLWLDPCYFCFIFVTSSSRKIHIANSILYVTATKGDTNVLLTL